MEGVKENISWNLIVSPKKTITQVIGNKKNLPFVLTVTALIGAYYAIADPEEIINAWIIVAMVISALVTVTALYLGAYILHTLSKKIFKGQGSCSKMVLGVGITGVITLISIATHGIYLFITGENVNTITLFEDESHFVFDLLQIVLTVWWVVIVLIAVSIIEKIVWWKSIIVSIITALLMSIIVVTSITIIGLSLAGFVFINILTGSGI